MSRITTEPMPLSLAGPRSDKIMQWLGKFCDRMMVTGSIRREQPLCNDIDIVCIPKFEERTVKVDMFTSELQRVNLLREFLCGYVATESQRRRAGENGKADGSPSQRPQASGSEQTAGGAIGFVPSSASLSLGGQFPCWRGRDGNAGPEPKLDAENLLLVTAAGVQLDLWVATEATWWTRVICRTGSVQHNIWAANRAKEFHGHWQPYQGLCLHGADIALTCEEDFYRALNVPFIPPRDREQQFLSRLNYAHA